MGISLPNSLRKMAQMERPPRGGLSEIRSGVLDQAEIAMAFSILRQPSRPNAPRLVAKSGRAARPPSAFLEPLVGQAHYLDLISPR
jgi:hypothetical protein